MPGRKPLPSNQRRVPLTVFIAPETNQKLREYASSGVSLGRVLDFSIANLDGHVANALFPKTKPEEQDS